MTLLLELTIIIVATKIAGDAAVRLGQPSVLGKLIIGVVIGPAVLGWIHGSEIIDAFSEIGVLLLMFFAGLETDIKDLNDNRNASAAVAIGGIVLPLLGGYCRNRRRHGNRQRPLPGFTALGHLGQYFGANI